MEEYGITGAHTPQENAYKYKYLLDVDGMTFSGRFGGLLRVGGLVFKVRESILNFSAVYLTPSRPGNPLRRISQRLAASWRALHPRAPRPLGPLTKD
jgi:hypothetical protein